MTHHLHQAHFSSLFVRPDFAMYPDKQPQPEYCTPRAQDERSPRYPC